MIVDNLKTFENTRLCKIVKKTFTHYFYGQTFCKAESSREFKCNVLSIAFFLNNIY